MVTSRGGVLSGGGGGAGVAVVTGPVTARGGELVRSVAGARCL